MSRVVVLAVPFVVAYVTSLLMVPLVTRFAIRNHLLDQPDGIRRAHARPVPRLGGVATFAGLIAAFALAPLVGLVSPAAPALPRLTASLIASCSILFLIGLRDDLRSVPPALKLAGQTIAALIVCYGGFRLDVLVIPPGYEIALGWIGIPISVVWLVGVSNALNLVDGLDGLAGGVSVIALLTATAAALVVGNPNVPWYTLALGGALLGFLHFNFPPARLFLGDSGSLVVGFLLAVFTVKGATRPDQATYALAPIFALSFPLLDTGFAMMRRWLRGTPLSRADARHIHHQLRGLGLSPRKAVLVIYAQSAAIAALGLCLTFAPPRLTLLVAAAGAAALLFILVYGVRWLEYHEFLEAGAALRSAARQARWVIQDKINARDVATLIRKAGTLADLKSIVEESAPLFRFSHMELHDGGSPRHLPHHVAGELHAARFCKLEYPIARGQKPGDAITLNIWCTTEVPRYPVSAERVARIIAPAINGWLAMGRLSEAAVLPLTAPKAAPDGVAPSPVPPAERERSRRSSRQGHADGERVPGLTMMAKPARGDELRS